MAGRRLRLDMLEKPDEGRELAQVEHNECAVSGSEPGVGMPVLKLSSLQTLRLELQVTDMPLN